MSLLEIKDLWVSVDNKKLLKGVNLEINSGEVHVLMGPNASGKTTLVFTILGYPSYRIIKGEIYFNAIKLNQLPIHERVKLGLAVAFQNPPAIRGVKLRDIIRLIGKKNVWDESKEPEESFVTPILNRVGLSPAIFRDRDINVGFSGGERKRAELAQVFASRPKLLILDEPDSGVDLDSLKLIGRELERFLNDSNCAALIITHYRYILPYIKPDRAHVMCHGMVIKTGDAYEVFTKIEERGYCEYLELCPPELRLLIEKKN